MNEQPVIEMCGVRKSFGRKAVLKGLDLTMPAEQTFAFLGRNGEGKTTTIRMLLGLLKPDEGTVRVLGMDPQKQALEIRRRVGYVAEDQVIFGWMRVEQLMSFVSPFYPTWDAAWAKQLRERFELPLKTRVKHLSKGQGVRVALLLALAHRPELVILDDPTLGLDPIMRKEFLRDLVTYLQGERVSVFFSSHLLYEVEPVADSVVILDHGRVLRQAETEELREKVKRVVAPAEAEEVLRRLPGILDISRVGRQMTVVVEEIEAVRAVLEKAGVEGREIDLNLDEIFEAYVIGRRKEQENANLLWKEWREQGWKLGFGCIVLAAIALIGLHSRIVADESMLMLVCFLGLMLLPVLASSGLVPAERSDGSFESLLALPVKPGGILAAKTLMGCLLCVGPLAAAGAVSVLAAGGREMTTGAMIDFYGRAILAVFSLFVWMMALTIRLPNETRASLLGIGVLIFWMIATVGLARVENLFPGLAGPRIPAAALAVSPLSFVYGGGGGFAKGPPLILALAVQAVILGGLWCWSWRRVGMEGQS